MLNNINCSVQLFVSNKQQKRERSKGRSLFLNGAGDGLASETILCSLYNNIKFIEGKLIL